MDKKYSSIFHFKTLKIDPNWYANIPYIWQPFKRGKERVSSKTIEAIPSFSPSLGFHQGDQMFL
jgi:hypothetical protein